jgi:hypothetical protein
MVGGVTPGDLRCDRPTDRAARSMTGGGGKVRSHRWSAVTMGSSHRRRAILSLLLAGMAVSGLLVPFVTAGAVGALAIFAAGVMVDVALLRRRQLLVAERLMDAAFRASRPPRAHPVR